MGVTFEQLLGPLEVRDLASSLGLRPTKTLGQNFVIDPNTIRRIVALAQLSPEDTVLEVGPGLGSLTLGLLDAAHRVLALEIDPVLAAQLPQTIERFRPGALARCELLHADALKVVELPAQPRVLVANLPYNVAVPVLLHLLGRFPSLESALVMVQDEVADRLAARPGSKVYGVPSVKAGWFGEVSKVGVVGTQVFWPSPKIKSGLVQLRRHAQPFTGVSRERVFAVVDAAFAQRRKTLRSALASWAGSAKLAGELVAGAGLDPSARGETLSVGDFVAIARAAQAKMSE